MDNETFGGEEPDGVFPDAGDEAWSGGQGGRGLPYNLEAEQALLGGLLIDPEQFDFIEGKVREEDFFAPTHGMVFAAMQALRQRQQPLDPILLRNELKAVGRLDAVGGVTGLAALTDAATSGANVEHYAGIVQDLSSLRRLIKVCNDTAAAAAQPGAVATDLLGSAEMNVRSISGSSIHGKILPMSEVLKSAWDHIDKYSSDHSLDLVSGLATGFTELDQLLTGLHGDELIIVAGRPAMGKTTFALNILRNVVSKSGKPAVLFTLEMSAENIARNLLAAHARIEGQKLRNHNFSRDDMDRLASATDDLYDVPMWIDETPAISLSELRGKARHLWLKNKIELIIIDYLQLMTASSVARGRSREQEVSEISRGLKALAKELHVPVIALSQLSRKPEGRQESRPILSDLRESGAIEQDADVVLMLHRPEYYKADDHPGEAEVIIAKQRNGPTGTVNLSFIGNQLRFENLAVSAGYDPSEHS